MLKTLLTLSYFFCPMASAEKLEVDLSRAHRCDVIVCPQTNGTNPNFAKQANTGVRENLGVDISVSPLVRVRPVIISITSTGGSKATKEGGEVQVNTDASNQPQESQVQSSSTNRRAYNQGYGGGTQAARGGMGNGGVQYATGNEGYGAGIAGTAGYKGPKVENVGGFNVVDDGEAQTASQNTNSLAPPPGANSEIALNKASNDARNRGLAAASVPSSGGGVPSAGSKNLKNGKGKGPGDPDWIGDALEKMKDFAGGFWSANVTEYGQDSKFGAGRKGKRGKKGKGQLAASNAHADPAGALNKRLQLRGLASRLEFGRANEPIFHTMCLQYQEYARKNYIPDDKARCPRD